nr:unnamed protein product [Callosobruchus analis]
MCHLPQGSIMQKCTSDALSYSYR